MTPAATDPADVLVRPVRFRDLDFLHAIAQAKDTAGGNDPDRQLEQMRRWFGPLKVLRWFPNPAQHALCISVAEQDDRAVGAIHVAPFNKQSSTWRVERVCVSPDANLGDVGSVLLRHCLETIWEARTWVLEVDVSDQQELGLYRRNGFQPLAQLTYWAIASEPLAQIAQNQPRLPNLLPAGNADAQLLYQLDTVSMPPLLRQVFDRHIDDFRTNILQAISRRVRQWFGNVEFVRGYVFEPQRKAAIGYFQLALCRDGSHAHAADLTVHPAYTWLYPELIAQMAQVAQTAPPQSLQLVSADYQPEREAYFEQLAAERIAHALLMSRSVWHKLREAKPAPALDRLQLSGMLQGLQPRRTPIPSRLPWLRTAFAQRLLGGSSRMQGSCQDGNDRVEPATNHPCNRPPSS
ncbi:acetyltransferase [Rubidibacter lacunae KORDI 51-2]|uniref:Acetyltransferase n=1 Tax=Rubidibacter lacunae KORDI 51-2 TaxID=582515 RepID=U5DKY5_9CHRO|nr:GNAT family N-acetyltransferase [Rubidibacter lacunae]ERN41224.1 acetyltransferase [Rubidibacter lacunae KORDI 51-2]